MKHRYLNVHMRIHKDAHPELFKLISDIESGYARSEKIRQLANKALSSPNYVNLMQAQVPGSDNAQSKFQVSQDDKYKEEIDELTESALTFCADISSK